MNRHIKSVHEGKKPFKGNICDAGFARRIDMKKHIESVHEGKKPFKCKECEAAFFPKRKSERAY